MHTPDPDVVRDLLAVWIEHRNAAAELLVAQLNLDNPRDVLKPENRGHHKLPGTGWQYRTHGIGVDVTRTNGHGGIDFDFSAHGDDLFAPPDWWRLQLFAKRSVHDKTVDSEKYRVIIDHADEYKRLIGNVISGPIGR